MKLTLFGVWRHLLHESNEVEQELSVVVGKFQIIAVLPEEQTWCFNSEKEAKNKHIYAIFTLCLICPLHRGTQSRDAGSQKTCPLILSCSMHVLKLKYHYAYLAVDQNEMWTAEHQAMIFISVF